MLGIIDAEGLLNLAVLDEVVKGNTSLEIL
jgi:hypothetical protein